MAALLIWAVWDIKKTGIEYVVYSIETSVLSAIVLYRIEALAAMSAGAFLCPAPGLLEALQFVDEVRVAFT